MTDAEPNIQVEALVKDRQKIKVPIAPSEIWVSQALIANTPAALTADLATDGTVTLYKSRALQPVGASGLAFELAATPALLTQVVFAPAGSDLLVDPRDLGNVLDTPATGADGYAPVLVDAAGVRHPLDLNVWTIDGVLNTVEFPFGFPANITPPLHLTWFSYVGATGGVSTHAALPDVAAGDDHSQYLLLGGRNGAAQSAITLTNDTTNAVISTGAGLTIQGAGSPAPQLAFTSMGPGDTGASGSLVTNGNLAVSSTGGTLTLGNNAAGNTTIRGSGVTMNPGGSIAMTPGGAFGVTSQTGITMINAEIGDVAITAIKGSATLTSVTGNVTLTATAGNISLDPGGGQIGAGSARIVSVADPTAAQDAATKQYVDDRVGEYYFGVGALGGTLPVTPGTNRIDIEFIRTYSQGITGGATAEGGVITLPSGTGVYEVHVTAKHVATGVGIKNATIFVVADTTPDPADTSELTFSDNLTTSEPAGGSIHTIHAMTVVTGTVAPNLKRVKIQALVASGSVGRITQLDVSIKRIGRQ